MRTVNPLGRVPSLTLPNGTTLIDSAAILDWLDQTVGPERALLPPGGASRQEALQRIALATGTIDKVMAIAYERLIRPAHYRWPDWIARCRTQAEGGIAALAAHSWPADAPGRSGLHHHRLHGPLHLPGRSGPAAARPVSVSRCSVAALRSAAGVSGDLSRRLCGAIKSVRLQIHSTTAD